MKEKACPIPSDPVGKEKRGRFSVDRGPPPAARRNCADGDFYPSPNEAFTVSDGLVRPLLNRADSWSFRCGIFGRYAAAICGSEGLYGGRPHSDRLEVRSPRVTRPHRMFRWTITATLNLR